MSQSRASALRRGGRGGWSSQSGACFCSDAGWAAADPMSLIVRRRLGFATAHQMDGTASAGLLRIPLSHSSSSSSSSLPRHSLQRIAGWASLKAVVVWRWNQGSYQDVEQRR